MVLGRVLGLGPLKLALIGIVGLGVVIGGAFALGFAGTPEVVGVDNRFGDVNETTTVIETDLVVHNPNPIGVTIGGLTIDYEVRMNDISMATGGREGVRVDRGNSTISFTNEMDNERIPDWWVSHLQNDEVTQLEVHADVHSARLDRTFEAPAVERTINTSVIEAFNSEEERELNADQPVIQDPVLIVRETRGEWGEIDEERTEIEMEFVVYNPREYPITVTEIGYDIEMNDVDMGEGETDREYIIPPGETETIEATTRMNNRNLDDWWVSHLENDQVTHLEVDFYLRVDLSAAGGDTVRIPFDTMEQTIETDIFGNKEDSDAEDRDGDDRDTDDRDDSDADDSDADGGDEDDGETNGDEDGEDDTDETTPTPTPEDTPTSTPEEDDDDGLL